MLLPFLSFFLLACFPLSPTSPDIMILQVSTVEWCEIVQCDVLL